LRAVEKHALVRQSVLTGNMRVLAELKLRVFGLADQIDFAIGAYGDDALNRIELTDYAWQRASEQYGERYDGTNTVLIGDTLLDIATAKAAGARVIAVASGSTSASELSTAGADLVLDDLVDTSKVVNAINAALLG